MAAGAGRRMGSIPKSLLTRDGEPLLLRQLRVAAEAGVHRISVVLGHYADQVAAVLERSIAPVSERHAGLRASSVLNPAPDDGTGSSLRCGLAALPSNLSAYLVLLGDQPLLEAKDVQAVLAAWQARAAGIQLVVPRHGARLGHPVAFGRELYDEVANAVGVREWRLAHPERVAILPAQHARYTTDIDVPADLDRLRDAFGVRLTQPET